MLNPDKSRVSEQVGTNSRQSRHSGLHILYCISLLVLSGVSLRNQNRFAWSLSKCAAEMVRPFGLAQDRLAHHERIAYSARPESRLYRDEESRPFAPDLSRYSGLVGDSRVTKRNVVYQTNHLAVA